MELISDILLGAGAFAAGLYCVVLARRLKSFTQLENGMGGAIAVLSAQVDDMTRALESARGAAGDSARSLNALTERAEGAAGKLELMLATLHDIPDDAGDVSRRVRVQRRRARTGAGADDVVEAGE